MRKRLGLRLDAETVLRMKKARAEGLTYVEIGQRFGCSDTAVGKLLKPQAGGK